MLFTETVECFFTETVECFLQSQPHFFTEVFMLISELLHVFLKAVGLPDSCKM